MRKIAARFRLLELGLLAILVVFNAASRGAAGGETAGPAVPVFDSSRIVSIGGSITEILYALGLQNSIVAVDTTSLYPPHALQEKPNVGYMRQLSAEGVLGLSPTLILAIDGSGPKETVDVLQQAKVPMVMVPDRFSGDGIVDKIELIARDTGVPERGKCLADAVRHDLASLDALHGLVGQPLKVAFILSLANGRPLISGRGTAADGIIAMAGARNAFDDFGGYKMVNDEAIVAAKPDAILVMQRGEHALSAATVFAQPALAMTPAAAHQAFMAMDGLYLLGFGPRTASAARDLAIGLYPELKDEGVSSAPDRSRASCEQ